MSKAFTHLDADGKAQMVDVGGKASTERVARAQARVFMSAETLAMIDDGSHKKGDVLSVARIAGIQAAKQCSHLIPLCHPLMLTSVTVDLALDAESSCVTIEATCRLSGQTGVKWKRSQRQVSAPSRFMTCARQWIKRW